MKTKTLFSIFFVFFFTLSVFAQNIITVDNSTAAADSDYTSIDSAIANANIDDIIMVYGSPISYGTVTVNKRVKIIGVGYYLTENPNTQTTGSEAVIQNIYFQAGASGASLIGMYLSSTTSIQEDNIFLQRCRLNSVYIYNRNGIIIDQCISGPIRNESGGSTTGLTVSNSSISAIYSASNTSTNIVSGTFLNNIFTHVGTSLPKNSIYKNNIFTYSSSAYYTVRETGGNIFSNNIWVQSQGPKNLNNGNSGVNTGNLFGASAAALFLGATGNSTDGQYQLKASSPALGAGQGGVDCGIFGGTTPYVLSGIPPIPTIYELNAATSATTSGGLQVEIKLKTN
jgi:hypothetical protein